MGLLSAGSLLKVTLSLNGRTQFASQGNWLHRPPFEIYLLFLILLQVTEEIPMLIASMGCIMHLTLQLSLWEDPAPTRHHVPKRRYRRVLASWIQHLRTLAHNIIKPILSASTRITNQHQRRYRCQHRYRRYSNIRGTTHHLTHNDFLKHVYQEFEQACGHRLHHQKGNHKIRPWVTLAASR
jgi:hypothetical protein